MTTQRTTYRSVFAVREFRLLFGGMAMYGLGFTFELLALSVLVYAHSHSAFLAAVAFSTGFVPQLVGGMLFTSLADRLPPRLVITAGLLFRATPGVLIGLLPSVPVPVMLVTVAVPSAVSPVYNAAISAILPDVLDGDRYVVARSVLSLTSAATQITGMAAGGAILALMSARGLMLTAGAALIVSAAIRFGLPSSQVPRGEEPAGVVRATMAGNAALLRDPRIRGLLLATWAPASINVGAEALIVPYTASLGQPSGTAGLLLAAMPVGMLLGDGLVGRFCGPATRERLAFPLALLLGVPMLAMVLRPPVPVVFTLLMVAGTGFSYQLGIQRAFLDSVPPDLRGRAFGLSQAGLMGGQGVLPSLTGAIASLVGPAGTMTGVGAALIVSVLALRRPLRPGAGAVPVDDRVGDVAGHP
jgi:predicted MFS family arabinose efflux permease